MIDWIEKAKEMNYDDPRKMIVDLYYAQGMSLDEIADKLIVSKSAVQQFMENSSLPRRDTKGSGQTRGGPKCPDCGAQNSKVLWSSLGEFYYRHRQCRECKRKFTTKEVVEDDIECLIG